MRFPNRGVFMATSFQSHESTDQGVRTALDAEYDPLSELRRIRRRLDEELARAVEEPKRKKRSGRERIADQNSIRDRNRDLLSEAEDDSQADFSCEPLGVRRYGGGDHEMAFSAPLSREPHPASDLFEPLPVSPLFTSLTKETAPLGGPLGESLHALLVSLQSDEPSPNASAVREKVAVSKTVPPLPESRVTEDIALRIADMPTIAEETISTTEPAKPESRDGKADRAAPRLRKRRVSRQRNTETISATKNDSAMRLDSVPKPSFWSRKNLAAAIQILGWTFLGIGLTLILCGVFFKNPVFWTIGVRIACTGAATILVRSIGTLFAAQRQPAAVENATCTTNG